MSKDTTLLAAHLAVSLDAVDLAYLISMCRHPYTFPYWGERAAAAETRGWQVVAELVPGAPGKQDGYTLKQYAHAGRLAFEGSGYTWTGAMS